MRTNCIIHAFLLFFNHIISLKQTHIFLKYALLFLDDNMDEGSSLKCGFVTFL